MLIVQTTKASGTRTQVMDENIQQNPNKNGTSILETRSGTKQKNIRQFLPSLKANKLKLGQNGTHLKSRPIAACPGSLLHPLGIWIDRKLQTLAKQQVSYFRNSYELRQELYSTTYPQTRNSSLRTQSQYIQISPQTPLSC